MITSVSLLAKIVETRCTGGWVKPADNTTGILPSTQGELAH